MFGKPPLRACKRGRTWIETDRSHAVAHSVSPARDSRWRAKGSRPQRKLTGQAAGQREARPSPVPRAACCGSTRTAAWRHARSATHGRAFDPRGGAIQTEKRVVDDKPGRRGNRQQVSVGDHRLQAARGCHGLSRPGGSKREIRKTGACRATAGQAAASTRLFCFRRGGVKKRVAEREGPETLGGSSMAWSHTALCNRISRIIGNVTHKPVAAGGICRSTSKSEHPPAGEGRQQAPANSSAVRVIDAAHQAPNGKAQQSAERSRQKRRGGIRSMIPTAPILDRRMQGRGCPAKGVGV